MNQDDEPEGADDEPKFRLGLASAPTCCTFAASANARTFLVPFGIPSNCRDEPMHDLIPS
jgi:hypothetical protein